MADVDPSSYRSDDVAGPGLEPGRILWRPTAEQEQELAEMITASFDGRLSRPVFQQALHVAMTATVDRLPSGDDATFVHPRFDVALVEYTAIMDDFPQLRSDEAQPEEGPQS